MNEENVTKYINEQESWEQFKTRMTEIGIPLTHEDGTFKSLYEVLNELAERYEKGEISLDSDE